MKTGDPMHYLPWLASRASGVVALVLITLAVLMGLAMAAKALRRPGLKRAAARLHEHVALTALAALAVHGLTLLGDGWLKPGWQGITVPFALSYRPGFTGVGIIAGYLAMLLGPSFYVRRRLGAARWRKVHRISVLIWVLSAVHVLGSGSDASQLWLRCLVLAPVVPLSYLLVLRSLRGRTTAPARRAAAQPPGALSSRGAPGGGRGRSATVCRSRA